MGCDDEGLRLPVRVDATSNGEFEPVPLAPPAPAHATYGPRTRRELLRYRQMAAGVP
jgi:hypothetical protein